MNYRYYLKDGWTENGPNLRGLVHVSTLMTLVSIAPEASCIDWNDRDQEIELAIAFLPEQIRRKFVLNVLDELYTRDAQGNATKGGKNETNEQT